MAFSIDERVRSTYFSLRIGVAILGLIFPLLLWGGGGRTGIALEPSMSAYYHATADAPSEPVPPCNIPDASGTTPAGTMRNWFVGILFAVGAMLYVNKGFSNQENLALNLAGIFALGIALFPMSWTCQPTGKFSMHGLCAVTFFLCIAFVCEFCSGETLKLLNDKGLQSKFRKAYHGLAIFMLVSPLCAFVVNALADAGRARALKAEDHIIFWVEAFGIWSFAAFWLTKSYEIKIISRQVNHGPVAAATDRAVAA